MEMWGIIQIASLVLIVVLLYVMWRADSKITKLEEKIDKNNNK